MARTKKTSKAPPPQPYQKKSKEPSPPMLTADDLLPLQTPQFRTYEDFFRYEGKDPLTEHLDGQWKPGPYKLSSPENHFHHDLMSCIERIVGCRLGSTDSQWTLKAYRAMDSMTHGYGLSCHVTTGVKTTQICSAVAISDFELRNYSGKLHQLAVEHARQLVAWIHEAMESGSKLQEQKEAIDDLELDNETMFGKLRHVTMCKHEACKECEGIKRDVCG